MVWIAGLVRRRAGHRGVRRARAAENGRDAGEPFRGGYRNRSLGRRIAVAEMECGAGLAGAPAPLEIGEKQFAGNPPPWSRVRHVVRGRSGSILTSGLSAMAVPRRASTERLS